ncbi:hypothetical protein SAMN05519103_09104 [Rhizobiales bacterium GAS113]|nr:hypothetical protein SAMN05519103_09104 [Rhizobiales bacterium GAS113]
MPSTHSLDPTYQLKQAGLSLSATMLCPTCRAEFTAMNGVNFPTQFEQEGQECFGPVLFCSTVCILAWFPPQQLDKC